MLSTGFWNMLKLGFMIRPVFFYLYGVSIGLFVWKSSSLKMHRISKLSPIGLYDLNHGDTKRINTYLCQYRYRIDME